MTKLGEGEIEGEEKRKGGRVSPSPSLRGGGIRGEGEKRRKGEREHILWTVLKW